MDEAQMVVEFIMENLELIMESHSSSFLGEESPVFIALYEDLKIIKSFLERLKECPLDRKKAQVFSVLSAWRYVGSKILASTDSYIINAFKEDGGFLEKRTVDLFQESSELVLYAKQINSFKKEIVAIIDDDSDSSVAEMGLGGVSDDVSLSKNETITVFGEGKMVGCDDQANALLDKLIGEQKQLEVISIVGMGGIGKTTLAKRLYNDPQIRYRFHVRGWTPGPPMVRDAAILHNLLSCIIDIDRESLHTMSMDEMLEKLYKCLKGRRYLIAFDNVWDFGNWSFWKWCFPDDRNGSRMLITSRVSDAFIAVSPRRCLHFVRPLSQEESWDLFESKVFADKSCPPVLMELGNQIVAGCKGLPLAIVVVSGLAKKDKTRDWWMHIAKNLSSSVLGEDERFMDILALSYDHLPNWLKSCFLYLGSFPHGHEFRMKKLVRTWIAEGFIKHCGDEKLEDVAQSYLVDLVERSLVIVSKRRSNGGIKSCHIHDLLRDLCAKIAKDNLILQPICGYEHISSSPHPSLTVPKKLEEKIIQPLIYGYRGPSLFCDCFHSYNYHRVPRGEHLKILQSRIYTKLEMLPDYSFVYKLLRLLDLGYIILDYFPLEILQLVHLKYLALVIYVLKKLPPLSNLWNLETFVLVIEKGQSVTLPADIWEMVKLRHLHISGELEFENTFSSSSKPPPVLHNLQSISQLCPSGSLPDLWARIPNLKSLGCHLTLSDKHFEFPDLSSLKLLETMKFEYQTLGMIPFCIPQPDRFPPNLKKLTLIGSHLGWKDMSIIGMLPNLEVLKIKDNFLNESKWEASDEGFYRLKFLKLSHVDLQQWLASSNSFPCIEHLVLNGCLDLEEIPSSFGDIDTLQIIEVYHSSTSAADSALEIQQSQKCNGKEDLQVFIYHHFEEN